MKIDKLTEWMTTKFNHPLSLPLFLLGIILILLSLTTGFELPVLKKLSIDPTYREISLLIGSILLFMGILFTISYENFYLPEFLIKIIGIGTAIICSISLSLSNLKILKPHYYYSSLILSLILILLLVIPKKSKIKSQDSYRDKSTINSIWKRLVSIASQSIHIFAGDVSWIERDEETFIERISKGVTISVLCRRPQNNALLKSNIARLIKSGSKVKYYDVKNSPVIRGLVVDGEVFHNNTSSLTVSKTARMDIERKDGVPGTEDIYNYEGLLYKQENDNRQIRLLSQLFHSLWKQHVVGVVLKDIALNKNEIAEILSVVPQYASLKPSDIKFDVINVNNLSACCTYVKDYKFQNTNALIDAYQTQ